MSTPLPSSESHAPRAAWLRDARWGLVCHYLDHGTPASATTPSSTTAEEWNRRIDGFDVPRFVAQLVRAEVPYVIFTLGQNSGHYCSPNATYDSLVGIQPSKCSRRDLIADLAAELRPTGIRLIAYCPSGAPETDAIAAKQLEWKPAAISKDARQEAFQRKWEAVLREWSLRWGRTISGWWIDGCYTADAMYRHPEAPNFTSFAAALRAGNPDAILSFNSGTAKAFDRLTEEADYTPGEVDNQFPVGNKISSPTPVIDGAHYHIMSYLGSWWGEGEPRFVPEFVEGYTRQVNRHGGAISWDVPIGDDGTISPEFWRQLDSLRKKS